ncbi:GNAT family N-acetyltransferase [Pseudoroseomonas globiformis]|uniref:GNAT family N-acetyltransferase n=1 Tax=Teichococcus globiformis TaxID=2307229 RepID=A0ABV7G5W9_9PROT
MEIVCLATRPDLAPVVASWLWEAFWREGGTGLAEVEALVATAAGPSSLPQSFVLLEDGVPAGTASLAARDLEERPDLAPWLAGLYVAPEYRGRGHARRLVAAVEEEAARQGEGALWLYTAGAEGLYEGLGWVRAARVVLPCGPVVLMRRVAGISRA